MDNSIILLNTQNIFAKSIEFAENQKTQTPLVFDMADKTEEVVPTVDLDPKIEEKITRIYTNYCEAGLVMYIVRALILVQKKISRTFFFKFNVLILGWSFGTSNWYYCSIHSTS